MKNRVLGIIGIGAKNANWNADFEGNPKNNLGEFVASPFALKYAYRNFWREKGLDVFFAKRYKKTKEGLLPMSLDDNIANIKKNAKTEKEIEKAVFNYIDVPIFGGTFATKIFTKSYVGTVQFGYGVNKFDEAEMVIDTVMSPFQNANKEENKKSTLGTTEYLTEAHFFYDFIINTRVNDELLQHNTDIEGFTRKHYEEFKQASLVCANSLNSVAKKGCYNEFAMFIELKEDSLKYLGNISDKLKFYKNEEGKGIIDLSEVSESLNLIKDHIESIEIYHNPLDTEVIISEFDNLTIKNIITENNLEIDFSELA